MLAVVAGVLAYPKEGQILRLIGLKHANLQVKQGLDLQGGAELTFQADLKGVPASQQPQALSSLITNIQKRADFGGAGEVSVQLAGGDRVVVDLPGVKDVHDAINTIGQTAQLTFYEVPPNSQTPVATGLTGKDLASATADIATQTSQPIISFQLKSEAVQKFSALTTRINQENGDLLITLDQQTLFDGTVSSPITTGQGQMTGFSSVQDAQNIAQLLNAGALPVPITLVEQTTVGPTLGAQSVSRSFVAGLIGLGIVVLFMLSYYRLAGLVAVAALAIYTALTLTLYKLSVFVPGFTIVLTLGGIAGFIISIGMAVDANILIFERLKEEVRSGKQFVAALETAFTRAWTSVRASNISTLITCAILYHFGSQTIQGFAITLGVGVLISLFTSVIITRTIMRVVVRQSWGHKASWYGIKLPEPKEASV
jgi:preprotein translocase subunit SecD